MTAQHTEWAVRTPNGALIPCGRNEASARGTLRALGGDAELVSRAVTDWVVTG